MDKNDLKLNDVSINILQQAIINHKIFLYSWRLYKQLSKILEKLSVTLGGLDDEYYDDLSKISELSTEIDTNNKGLLTMWSNTGEKLNATSHSTVFEYFNQIRNNLKINFADPTTINMIKKYKVTPALELTDLKQYDGLYANSMYEGLKKNEDVINDWNEADFKKNLSEFLLPQIDYQLKQSNSTFTNPETEITQIEQAISSDEIIIPDIDDVSNNEIPSEVLEMSEKDSIPEPNEKKAISEEIDWNEFD